MRAFEFRAGGDFYTFMRGLDGKGGEGESDTPGCFLAIVPHERIVCPHQDEADSEKYNEMGFFDGWGTCISQLEAFAKRL